MKQPETPLEVADDPFDPKTPSFHRNGHAPVTEPLPRGPLPLRSPAEDCLDAPPDPPSIVRGLVVLGSMTEIAAYIRVGKTVFMLMLARATLQGRPFLGCPTEPAFWVWITEEGRPSFADALRRTGMDGIADDQMLILHRREVRTMAWPQLVKATADEAQRLARGLPVVLVVDTLSRCAGLGPDQENNSGAAAQVMDPLVAVLGPQLAIVCGRHDRKGGGTVGESSRGSSAFSGEMDVLLQLRRTGDSDEDDDRAPAATNVRYLKAASRFTSTPGQDKALRILWTAGEYAIAGDAEREERYQDLDEQILLYVAAHSGCTKTDVKDSPSIHGKAETILRRIAGLLQIGKLAEQPTIRVNASGHPRTVAGLTIGPFA